MGVCRWMWTNEEVLKGEYVSKCIMCMGDSELILAIYLKPRLVPVNVTVFYTVYTLLPICNTGGNKCTFKQAANVFSVGHVN